MMGRAVAVVLVVAMALVALVSVPAPTVPVAGQFAPTTPPSAACVVSVGRGEVGSLVAGPEAAVSTAAGPLQFESMTGLSDVAAAGPAWALVEHAGNGGAGFAQSGSAAAMAANCTPTTVSPAFVSGISTGNGRGAQLVVANPYARDAVIGVVTMSEVGNDAASELETIVVPAGGLVVRDLARILPLRTHLSLVMTPQSGAFHAAVFETAGSDGRVSESLPGSEEWWVIIPPIEGLGDIDLSIVPTSPGDSSFQIDTWSAGGLVEAAVDSVVADRSQYDLGGDGLAGVFAARIIATTSVGVGVSLQGDNLVAGGPAVPRLSTRWVLAGAGVLDGETTVWVFNPGSDETLIELTPIGGGDPLRHRVVGGGLRGIPVPPGAGGFVLQSGGEVAVVWTTVGAGLTYSTGIPTG